MIANSDKREQTLAQAVDLQLFTRLELALDDHASQRIVGLLGG